MERRLARHHISANMLKAYLDWNELWWQRAKYMVCILNKLNHIIVIISDYQTHREVAISDHKMLTCCSAAMNSCESTTASAAQASEPPYGLCHTENRSNLPPYKQSCLPVKMVGRASRPPISLSGKFKFKGRA